MYKEYNYGSFRPEIRKLLRKRLLLKDKIRYHKSKIENFETDELPKIEDQIKKLLERAKNPLTDFN